MSKENLVLHMKKEWKILMIGILIGVILTLGLLRLTNILLLPTVDMEEDLMLDDFSYESTDEG